MLFRSLAQPQRSWWVAHDQGRVIGFAGGRLAGADFEVLDVVVSADHRRGHVASRLVARTNITALAARKGNSKAMKVARRIVAAD